MTAYSLVLLLHSYLRWIVLFLGLAVLLRNVRGGAPWSKRDDRLGRAWISAVDTQVLLGLLLYVVLSPISSAALRDLRASMKESGLRFFAIEHVFAMTIAIAVAHVGWVRSKRAGDDRARRRAVFRTVALWLVAVLIGIPWPGLPYARPLARSIDLPASVSSAGSPPAAYTERCAPCHGASGHGDGPAAASLKPPPRDFADAAWQGRVTDEELHDVILRGGPSRKLSAAMPASDLPPEEIARLVGYIRSKRSEPR